MSWDPNQPQGQPPSGPNPYDPTQTPSSPQNPYEQEPAATPPQNPYEQPSQYAPPPQNPYASPTGLPAYQQTAYGYAPPPATPLPLGQALQGLFNQYLKITTKPGAQSFAEEQGKADWGIIWIQLLIVGVLGSLIGLARSALGMALMFSSSGGSGMTPAALIGSVAAGSASVGSIISVIVGFFIVVGIQYLLAKAFKGTGDFKQQAYGYLLFYAPLTIISYILGLIPILGGIIGFALFIYEIVLNVFQIMAAHRLSGGKATAVVLIPYAVLFLLLLICGLILAAILMGAASGLPSTTP